MFNFYLVLDNGRLFYRNYMVGEVYPVTAKTSIFDVILKAIRAKRFSLFGRVGVSWTHCPFPLSFYAFMVYFNPCM